MKHLRVFEEYCDDKGNTYEDLTMKIYDDYEDIENWLEQRKYPLAKKYNI